MLASKPGYNLHPRYNRPVLRRQKRNDGRRENTHGNTERHTAGKKTRPDRQTTPPGPERTAEPDRTERPTAAERATVRRSATADRKRRQRSARPATAPDDRSEPVSPAQIHARQAQAASPVQDQRPRRILSAAPDAVKAEAARTAQRGRTRPHARRPGH